MAKSNMKCPKCGSTDIIRYKPRWNDDDTAHCQVICNNIKCEHEWEVTLRLQPTQEDIIEALKRYPKTHDASWRWPEINYPLKPFQYDHACLHNSCSECHGTGRKVDGSMCIHHISCGCRRCTPYCGI